MSTPTIRARSGYVRAFTGDLGEDATPTRRHLQPVLDAVDALDACAAWSVTAAPREDPAPAPGAYGEVTFALLDRVLDGLRRL